MTEAQLQSRLISLSVAALTALAFAGSWWGVVAHDRALVNVAEATPPVAPLPGLAPARHAVRREVIRRSRAS